VLTIKSFSKITAIPESTLRYYDEQGILSPRGRAESGYRLYEAEQILPAKFLYSLRLASIPMGEVRAYQQDPPERQQEALSRWHGELGERIAWLSLARKYIEAIKEGRREDVNLQVTPPERVAWFIHDGPIGMFGEHYMRRHKELTAAGFTISDSYFEWVADLQPGWVRGKVGYTVTNKGASLPALPEGGELEDRPSMLTLSLEHRAPMDQIRSTYSRLFTYMKEHGWEGAGPSLERYPVGPPEMYVEVLIPILRLER
jgi:DNA-binding transcriptional MerR regulator